MFIFDISRVPEGRSAASDDDRAGFLASCDELGDHISDYSQAVQRGSLILYCGGREGVTGTSLWPEGLKKSTHEAKKRVKGS